MQARKRLAAVAVAGTCVLAGAAAGISQSAASSSSGKSSAKAGKAASSAPRWGHIGAGGPGGPGGHGEVHAVEVVLNKAGTAYISVTEDSGTIKSVDTGAGTITVTEGTSTVTYATPTITIPSGATVTLDGATSSLEKLKEGDHVSISSSSEGTNVFATDSSFKPSEGHGPMGGMGGPPQGGEPPAA
jgi:hypothetical protein